METIPMTPEGYQQLVQKVDYLTKVEIPRLEKDLGEARERGDLSENAEYDAAREGLWNAERQLGDLQDRLARAEVIDSRRCPSDAIAIGALVKVEDEGSRSVEEILLVGEGETRSEYDCVSTVSPLGQAFIGKKQGETVEVEVPLGTLRYRILEFRYM